jgi:hypothetical protein
MMPLLVLNRNYTLRSLAGRSFEFRKDIPIDVPEVCYREAIAVGATPADGSDPNVLEDEITDRVPRDPVVRRNAIMAAILKIVDKNDREDFTAGAVPHKNAVTKLVGYSVEKDEIQAIWQAYCEDQAVSS